MFSIVIFSVLITFTLCTVLTIQLWPYRHSTVHRFIMVAQFIHAIWAFLVLTIFVTDDFETRVMLTRMRQLFLPALVPTWICMVTMVFYRAQWDKYKKWVPALYVLPVVTILGNVASILGFSFAEKWVFYDFQELSGFKGLLFYKLGPLISVSFLYNGIGILANHSMYLHSMIRGRGLKRKYAFWFMLGGLIASGFDFWGLYGSSNPVFKQVSVGGFWPACLIIYYIVTRLEFLDVKALAQERVFENLPSPVITLSPYGELWDANHAAVKLFSLEASQMGRDLQKIPSLSVLLGSPASLTIQEKTYQVFHYQLEIQGGETKTSVYVLNDISNIIHLNRELEESNLVLKTLNSEILSMTTFNKKVHSVLSHDMTGSLASVHTLLNGVRNMVSEGGTSEYTRHMDRLLQASSASLSLLQNVLTWSDEKEAARLISLRSVLESSIRQLSAQIVNKNIQIETTLPDGDIRVLGSRNILEAIFRNLLSNAIKFSHTQGKVHVELQIGDQWADILVQDWGLGMEPETVQGLLTGTTQGRELQEGYGVGMRFTLNFIREIKGQLFIDSELSKGTRVRLRIPLQESLQHQLI